MKQAGVYIIAEAGVNHNGSLDNAFRLIDAACEAKADAVKFQTFKPGECTGIYAEKVDYLKESSPESETRYDITCNLAMAFENFVKIKEYAQKSNITFLTTADGQESLDFVVNVLDVPLLKIASTEVTNLHFLEMMAETGKPLILSTGMSSLGDVETALDVIRKHNDDVTVLHCVSEYPAPVEEINLKAMVTLKNAFGVKVGFSDHTLGYEAAVAAAALGAMVIEKHITLDKNMDGPDHKASLNPVELIEFVQKIRNTEALLGDGLKKASESEKKNIVGIRRSIVASRDIEEGSRLTQDDLACKRPGSGIHPCDAEKIIGMRLNTKLKMDQPLLWEYFK